MKIDLPDSQEKFLSTFVFLKKFEIYDKPREKKKFQVSKNVFILFTYTFHRFAFLTVI